METGFIQHKQSNIHYYRFGKGEKLLLAFHGYGEDGSSFGLFEKYLETEFTIIAIDFPFHGKTEWNEGLLFTIDDLINIINLINQLLNQPINLLGYSMGGRVALYLTQNIPAKINSVVLIAPDGLHKNLWHYLATQTVVSNKLFSLTMQHPDWLFALMKVAVKFNLFNKSIINFVHYYLDNKESRMTLYKRWTTMRRFAPNLSLIKKIIRQRNIAIKILFGKYDKIIVTKTGKAFAKGEEDLIKVIEIEAGHQLLKEKYAMQIMNLFKS
jgi:pimeloyl-ACP methyl ester carboxylesterase